MRKPDGQRPAAQGRTTEGGGSGTASTSASASSTSSTPSTSAASTAASPARRARVRNRLLLSVVLCSTAVLGAGTPVITGAYGTVTESQQLVDRAELDKRAIALTHALADERDGMVEYVAAGRTSRDGAGVTEEQRARVDGQVTEIRETAPASARKALAKLTRIRQEAQAGRADALAIHQAYTAIVDSLQDVTAASARLLPQRATEDSSGGAAAAPVLPELGRAVQQASAVRGLIRGALAARGSQRALAAEAQRANVREQAALADFGDGSGDAARDTFTKTVTGADIALAERYLAKLTDQPYIGPADRALDRDRVDAALSARIDSMRGVQSSFATEQVEHLEKLRDDDVTALEWYIAFIAACLLLAAGISVQTARSMARPLSVLKRGSRRLAEDPAGAQEPVVFHGRDDEFAEVVRHLNTLRDTVAAARDRADEAEADNAYLVSHKDALTAERDRVLGEFDALKDRLDALSGAVHGTFVSLALRTLGLVERQLGVIEDLEEKESDPTRLSTLFKLDHLATRMRRYSENLLLLAGSEHGTAGHAGPVPLLDVLRAAVSEVERYERVQLGTLPPHTQVSGHAADDLSHLVAELLDNAVSFSPPDAEVQLSGWLLESGEVMLSVEDEGIGVTSRRLATLNARLSTPDDQDPPLLDESGSGPGTQYGERGPEQGLGMGLYVVARLAARHGLRVQLRERKQGGGLAAVVAVPSTLLPARPAPNAAAVGETKDTPKTAVASFPGSVAEANSHALPTTRRRPLNHTHEEPLERSEDPLVQAAEAAVREKQTAGGLAGGPLGGAAAEHSRTAPAPEPVRPQPAVPAPAPAPEPAPESASVPEPEPEPAPEPAPERPRLTGKGLPKRTPQHLGPMGGAPAPSRKPAADADEMRRRLGGFQRGAEDGRRDVEAELNADQDVNSQDDTAARRTVDEEPSAKTDGGTAEEART